MKEKEMFFTMRIPVSLKQTIKKKCVDLNIAMKEFCLEALKNQLSHIEKEKEDKEIKDGI